MISKAEAAPFAARTAAIVDGMSCIDAVFSTTSLQSSSLAGSPRRAMPCAARMPAGVAALPRPRRFALTFSLMAAMIPPSRDESGNSLRSRGASRRVSALTAPLRSSSSITALHRQTAPKSSKVKLTAAEAPTIRAFPASACEAEKSAKNVESSSAIVKK